MHIGASVPQPLPFPVVPSGTLLYTSMFVLASVGIQVVTLPYMTMMKCLWDFYSFGVSWFCQESWKRGGNNINQITWKIFLSLMHKLTDLCKAQLKWQDKTVRRGFPGGTVVRNPPAKAGDTGSGPGPGGSHMPRSSWARVPQLLSLHSGAREPQLSPRGTTAEAHVPRAHALQQERPPQWEAHALQRRVAPARRNWRRPAHRNEDPMQPKIK